MSEHGKGSTFTMRIPTPCVPLSQDPLAEAKEGAALFMVLAIDDDPVAQDLVSRMLGKEGFGVVLASSGAEGLRLARELRPDVITLDVLMPGLDAWAVLKELKSDAELVDMPVIVVSMLDRRAIAFTPGASDYTMKPVEHGRLVKMVQKYCSIDSRGPVLVVEDDTVTRDMSASMLRRSGWEVDLAEDGRMALECVAGTKPGLILLYLMMPEMDGFEFLEEFRRGPCWPSVPIVVVTAKELAAEGRQRLDGYVERVIQRWMWSQSDLLKEVRGLVMRHARDAQRKVKGHGKAPAG